MGGRVFVLGAGASIGHSAGKFPGIGDFFGLAKRLHITVAANGGTVFSEYTALEDYTIKRFGRSIVDPGDHINAEELLTNIQIDVQRTFDADLMSVEKSLKLLIRNVLVRLNAAVQVDDGEYHAFERRLIGEDFIVTFNWDLLLDKILVRQMDQMYSYQEAERNRGGVAQYKNFIEGFTIQNLYNPFSDNFRSPTKLAFPYTDKSPVTPLYLKLHGSIDWFVCVNTYCKASRELFVVADPDQKTYCSECHEPLSNLLVPPVLNKPLHEFSVIRKFWSAAARAMSAAEEVVIWGYSVPPTDFHSRWLLRHSRQSRLETITIINPDLVRGRAAKAGARIANDYVDKVLSIFSGIGRPLRVKLYEYFSDYLNEQDIFSKHRISRIPKSLAEIGSIPMKFR